MTVFRMTRWAMTAASAVGLMMVVAPYSAAQQPSTANPSDVLRDGAWIAEHVDVALDSMPSGWVVQKNVMDRAWVPLDLRSANFFAYGGPVAPQTFAARSDASAKGNAATVDCSKVFAPSDVAGILSGPIQIERDAYPIGCEFEGTGASVRVDVDSTLDMAWNSVVANADFVDLPGVGDQARRRASNGYEVVSKKGKLYCGAGFSMQSTGTKLSGEELGRRLGALCNKLFAASS